MVTPNKYHHFLFFVFARTYKKYWENIEEKNNDEYYGFSSRAENHLGPKLMNIEFINQVKVVNIIASEIAYVNASLCLQRKSFTNNY